jgi:phenylpyruvate tautomerase PptA (4-oxalocrotonate tautomerase family)
MKKVLRDLADAYEREEEGEKSAALAAEIADLKAKVEAAPAAKVTDALEEITEEEYELIRQHRAGTPPPAPAAVKTPKEEKPTAKKTRPGRKSGSAYQWYTDDEGRVVKTDIPQVYQGADEADEVELPEEPEANAA